MTDESTISAYDKASGVGCTATFRHMSAVHIASMVGGEVPEYTAQDFGRQRTHYPGDVGNITLGAWSRCC